LPLPAVPCRLEHPATEEELAEIEAWLSIGPELEPWE
jgi:hypothetical protein